MGNRSEHGILVVKSGPMGGDKTEYLIDHHGDESLAFIPDVDWRSDDGLRSHNGTVVTENVFTLPADNPGELFQKFGKRLQSGEITSVEFDETNFWGQALIAVVKELTAMGVAVYAAGLLLDSDLEDIGPTRELAMIADHCIEAFADCDDEDCEAPAVYNYFKGEKEDQVVVGAWELYGASCPDHYNGFREQYDLEPLPDKIVFSDVWEVKK